MTAAQLSAAFPAQGQITLQNGAQVDAGGAGGGRIVIRGGSLTVDKSIISANTTGAIDGQGIDISVLRIWLFPMAARSPAFLDLGLGAAGNLNVGTQAPLLAGWRGSGGREWLSVNTQISTSTGDPIAGAGGPARGGNITLNTGSLEMVNSAQISSASFGDGNAGGIQITASSIRMDALLTTVVQLSANTQEITGGGNAGEHSHSHRQPGHA